jgi:hypothetical protein
VVSTGELAGVASALPIAWEQPCVSTSCSKRIQVKALTAAECRSLFYGAQHLVHAEASHVVVRARKTSARWSSIAAARRCRSMEEVPAVNGLGRCQVAEMTRFFLKREVVSQPGNCRDSAMWWPVVYRLPRSACRQALGSKGP